MMDAPAPAVEFLKSLFRTLDRGDFAAVAELLTDDAELADELTGGWLRGRAAISDYLAKQQGVVTDVRSRLTSVAARDLCENAAVVTFAVRQIYRLSGDERHEDLLGTVLVDMSAPLRPKLRLLHLGPARPKAAL